MRVAPLLLLSLTSVAFSQPDLDTVARIQDEGKNRSQAMKLLRHLSVKIGTRLSTSHNLDNAYNWTQKTFKYFGCKNVKLEQWGEWPVGFQRGKSWGKMLGDSARTFEFTTPAWTEGTKGAKIGRAVLAPRTRADFDRVKDSLKGAWLIYATPPPRLPRPRPGTEAPPISPEMQAALDLQKAISAAGILGTVQGSNNELVITSGSWQGKTFEEHPKDVSVTVRKSDMEAIVKALEGPKPVELEFNLNNQWIKGPRKLYNVIAEIPGTTKPDEVVIVGGHLDTWDGPGSQGAADNGTGITAAMEAARILNKAGAKPDRTIRFVLFTGEEQGLYGSREYVKQHASELSKISCVFIEDGGANPESGTYALPSMVPFLQVIADLNNKAFPELPMKIRTVERMPRGGGSDHAPFNQVGVPAFFWDEEGTQNYTFIHHTQNDRIEFVPEHYMVQSAVNEAVTAYVMATIPEMMPRDVPPTTTATP